MKTGAADCWQREIYEKSDELNSRVGVCRRILKDTRQRPAFATEVATKAE